MSARVVVVSEQGYRADVRAGHHHVVVDEPAASGGTDAGPTPSALLLGALGGCTAITLRMYAQRKQWDLGTIEVEVRRHAGDDGERLERTLKLGAPLDDAQRAKLLEIADKTPVTKTLKAGVRIDTRVA